MTTAKFEVGDGEKHTVTVEATAPWMRRLKVAVDGKEVVSKLWSKSFGGSASVTVGQAEQHQVEVKVSGQFSAKIEASVDGKPVKLE